MYTSTHHFKHLFIEPAPGRPDNINIASTIYKAIAVIASQDRSRKRPAEQDESMHEEESKKQRLEQDRYEPDSLFVPAEEHNEVAASHSNSILPRSNAEPPRAALAAYGETWERDNSRDVKR